MKARLFVAALAFVALSSMAVAQEPAKSGCCQAKTECSQAKAGDKSTSKETAKKADSKKAAKATSKKAA